MAVSLELALLRTKEIPIDGQFIMPRIALKLSRWDRGTTSWSDSRLHRRYRCRHCRAMQIHRRSGSITFTACRH